MSEKLKPCPFCGNSEAPEVSEEGYDMIPHVVCNAQNGGCGASVYAQEESPKDPTRESAVALWNNPAIRRETIEECVKVMHSISTPDDKDIDTFIEQFPGEICREQAVVFMIQSATEVAFEALKEE